MLGFKSKKKIISTAGIQYAVFPEGNEIEWHADWTNYVGVPSNRLFYPKEEVNGNIVFIADGYGLLSNNEFGLQGAYGNGAVYIPIENLPEEIVEWARNNFIKKQI